MSDRVQQFMMQAYLDGEMDEQTEREFELRLLQDPNLAVFANEDLALSSGLRALPKCSSVPSMPIARRSKTLARKYLPLALAACIGSAITGMAMNHLGTAHIEGGATLAYVDKSRSLGDVIAVNINLNSPTVLMVPVASADTCVASIAVRQSGREYAANATSDEFGYAAVVLPERLLRAGLAEVRVRCNGENVGDYSIKVIE
jgi:hypothetical protein